MNIDLMLVKYKPLYDLNLTDGPDGMVHEGNSPNEIVICDPSSTISSNVCGGFPKSLIVLDNPSKELELHEIYYVDQAECPIPTPTPIPTPVRSLEVS